MPISTRFTEYGLTGAFFWITQVALFVLYARVDPANLLEHPALIGLAQFFTAMPDSLQGSAAALLGAIGIITIFVAGVMLELLPSIFTYPQMIAFRNIAKQNSEWMQPWAEAHGDPVRTDLSRMIDELPSRYFMASWRDFAGLRHYARWQRLQAMLFACVEVGGKAQGDLSDQLHLWRTSRVIGNTMLLMALEVLFFYDEPRWLLLIHFALYFAALLVTIISYHRLCYALFALVGIMRSKPAGPAPVS